MSYKNKKTKKGLFSQIKYRFGLAKIALLKSLRKVEKKETMRLRQTSTVMNYLREKTRLIRPNNPRISEWVDDYINRCILEGKPVEILTQFCLSKVTEIRAQTQHGILTPTKKERLLFEKEIPNIANLLKQNGIAFNWWITFNASYLDSGRIDEKVYQAYAAMIGTLAAPLVTEDWLMITDWERDIIGKRAEPNRSVLKDVERFVKPDALELEIQRQSTWSKNEAGLAQSIDEVKQDVYFQIACEAEEGRYLMSDAPFGEYIMIPLEAQERYDFFTLLAPDFKKRIVTALPTRPWAP